MGLVCQRRSPRVCVARCAMGVCSYGPGKCCPYITTGRMVADWGICRAMYSCRYRKIARQLAISISFTFEEFISLPCP